MRARRASASAGWSGTRQELAVPRDRAVESLVEGEVRLPAELAARLGRAQPLVLDLVRRRAVHVRLQRRSHPLQDLLREREDVRLDLVREVERLALERGARVGPPGGLLLRPPTPPPLQI